MEKRLSTWILVLGLIGCAASSANRRIEPAPAVDGLALRALPSPRAGQLRWPTADRSDDGWLIAANLFPAGLNHRIGRRSLYLAHSRRGLLPLPEGDFLFAYPLVKSAPDGSLDLFWAEGPESRTPAGWPYTLTALWHARFEAGRWLPAERVIGGTVLGWESRAPQVVTDDRGRFHLVVTVTDTGRPEETFHLVRNAAGWHRQGMGMHVSYPALASLPGGRLALAYAVGNNQLHSKTSTDYGQTWSPSKRVLDLADTSHVYKPQLRVVGDSVYLGWIGGRTADGEFWNVSRRRVSRRADLDSWTLPVRSPPLSGTLFNVTFAVDGCGNVRGLVELYAPNTTPLIRALRVHDDRMTVASPFGDAVAIEPLIERSGDRIIELWNGLRSQRDSLQPFFRELAVCS